MLDAIAYMKAKAAALGKPLVVNLSLGSYFGPRDGTSNFEQGLDNLSGPGVILVGAAGNEGNAKLRATGTIAQGGSVVRRLHRPARRQRRPKGGTLEIWYPGTDAYGVSVTGPVLRGDGAHQSGRDEAFDTPCGRVEITSTAPQPNNDDRQITRRHRLDRRRAARVRRLDADADRHHRRRRQRTVLDHQRRGRHRHHVHRRTRRR